MGSPLEPIDPRKPEEEADLVDDARVEGVRQQRRHIEELDGEDPLRGGVAD
jgi:hypothetical protein